MRRISTGRRSVCACASLFTALALGTFFLFHLPSRIEEKLWKFFEKNLRWLSVFAIGAGDGGKKSLVVGTKLQRSTPQEHESFSLPLRLAAAPIGVRWHRAKQTTRSTRSGRTRTSSSEFFSQLLPLTASGFVCFYANNVHCFTTVKPHALSR